VIPFLGNVPLGQLTREKVRDFVAGLVGKKFSVEVKEKVNDESGKLIVRKRTIERNMARPTIRIILSQLCALLSHAVEEKVIDINPAVKLGKFYKQAKVLHEEIQPLTREEVPTFLQAVLERSKDYYPIFLAAIHTGMRAGELIGLQWGDIDFNSKFIVVRRCFTRGRVELTKTGKQRRIDMSDTLTQALQSHQTRLKQEWLKKEPPEGEAKKELPEWVFPNLEGNPLEYYNLKHRHFEKCLAKAGLRRIRFHDLRHTFASLLIQNGESLAYIKDQLGHSSIKMTVDV
jgi:integrase